MNIKQVIKKAFKLIFAKRPIYTTANIATLAPNELLKGRKALITGGTSGIGYAIAEAFLKSGASVCITGRNEERLLQAEGNLQKQYFSIEGKICHLVLDNRDVSSFDVKLKEAIDLMEGLDILVNNAGVQGDALPTATEKAYDAVLNTNLKGVFFLSQAVGRYMKDNKIKGNILNIASSSSLRPATSAYTISKWGIRGLTLGLAKSLAPLGIVVNGVAPGPTATPMIMHGDRSNITFDHIPAGRYAMPQEIANMAVFLTSDMGRMIIGDIVYMTGGAGVLTFDDLKYSF
ncbi:MULTISPECIES: SDR family oxidoreductase [Bacteroidaceae]|uniref:SDR family oxidoreductase n=1 Tax=Phocaeicola intestinalis TaxID=2762212 RepID=A0ABR8Y869_9BACT|nr:MULTISPECIES: SDR family oxidoreductase [Bacteroidaceae]MBD8040358.1 SDR family oxidoreductase [Phocaeicola intestinalis]OUO74398.1 oxidoreductase [Bacteroides sp. An269]